MRPLILTCILPVHSVYILLGGYPPFFDDSRPALFKKIKSGKFEFHRQYWKDTSAEGAGDNRGGLEVDSECWVTRAVRAANVRVGVGMLMRQASPRGWN